MKIEKCEKYPVKQIKYKLYLPNGDVHTILFTANLVAEKQQTFVYVLWYIVITLIMATTIIKIKTVTVT